MSPDRVSSTEDALAAIVAALKPIEDAMQSSPHSCDWAYAVNTFLEDLPELLEQARSALAAR